MSSEDRKNTIGEAVEEYGDVKRELAALLARTEKHASDLKVIAEWLKPTGNAYNPRPERPLAIGDEPSQEVRGALGRLPTAAALGSLIDDAVSVRRRKSELAQVLKEVGAEPKD